MSADWFMIFLKIIAVKVILESIGGNLPMD
jgi:hypothetical protein